MKNTPGALSVDQRSRSRRLLRLCALGGLCGSYRSSESGRTVFFAAAIPPAKQMGKVEWGMGNDRSGFY